MLSTSRAYHLDFATVAVQVFNIAYFQTMEDKIRRLDEMADGCDNEFMDSIDKLELDRGFVYSVG